MKKKSSLQKLRAELRLTQTSFAKMLGISRTAVTYYEAHQRYPRLKIAYRILDIAKKNGIKLTLEDIYISK